MKRNLLDDRRIVLGGAGLAAALLLALTWFFGVGPQLAAADDHAAQQAESETQLSTLQAKISQLADQNDRMTELEDALVDAQGGLPTTTALPAFTRQVTGDAKAAGVTLDDVSISAPTGAVTGGSTPTPAAPADGSPAVDGPQAIIVTLTTKGTLREQVAFLEALQTGDRRALVNSTQTTVGGDSDGGSRVASVDAPNTMTTQVTIFADAA